MSYRKVDDLVKTLSGDSGAGAVLVEQHDEWAAADRRYSSERSIALLTAATSDQPEEQVSTMFKDDVAYTFGLLWAAAKAADAAGDSGRAKELRVVAREVARDFRNYTVDDIPGRIAELCKIREDNLG